MRDCAICLFFDPQTEALIRSIWDQFSRAGINSEMPNLSSNRPHITLTGCAELDTTRYDPVLNKFASTANSLPVTLESLGCFLGEMSTLFFAPIVSQELLRLHEAHHALATPFVDGPSPHYSPGQWVPHSTLGLRVPPEALPFAIAACRRFPLPITGKLESVGVMQVIRSSMKSIYDYPLRTT